MRIRSAKQSTKGLGGQWVNKVGKYLYNNLDGAFKFKKSVNMYDVYITLLYQVKEEDRREDDDEYNDVHEMTLDLNVTTYQNKLRINVIEDDKNERTIGHFVVSEEKLQDLESAKDLIYNKVIKQVSKAYEDFDFIF